MNSAPNTAPAIVPRQGPGLGLEGDIPKYWFGGDPFKTRLFDAMSLLFPEGEKFFIACVRDYRERIDDPELLAQVKAFTYQEGQHGMVHTRFNDRLKEQGVEVDHIIAEQRRVLFDVFRQRLPKAFTLGQTVASEHFTALMAHSFLDTGLFHDADPRIRAMYAWHAVEEIEHKAVAFDVYRNVARGSWLTRTLSMLWVSLLFPLHTFLIMRHMFQVDGLPARGRLWLRGLWWMYGPRGIFLRMVPDYLRYYSPRFHPWQHGGMEVHARWREAYETSGGDAVAAGDATDAMAKAA